jgi:hypothetical protein
MTRILVFIFSIFFLQGLSAQDVSRMRPNDPPPVDKSVPRDKSDKNNDFYDNEETHLLMKKEITIEGEIENPGKVDFTRLTKRSVIVKEALLNKDSGNQFVGAYRYDGYSLFDILKDRILKKNNAADFNPVIDVYVEIENVQGEKVMVSWGEIFYPNVLHQSIIATSVMRIVPSKTKDLWPLPSNSRLVMAGDLLSERNIRMPVRITVRSYKCEYKVRKDLDPLYSESVTTILKNEKADQITELTGDFQMKTLHTIFYGKGRGIHSTTPFTGISLKDYLSRYTRLDRQSLRGGLVVLAGIDGYRAVFTFSEIMNRSDQEDVLIVPADKEEKDGGRFRIFPSCDFFSDRAVKALSEIRVEIN